MKIKQLGIIGLLFLLALPFCLASAQAQGAGARQKQKLIIGGDEDSPPYEFLNKEGQPTGFNVELAEAATKVMGLSADIHLDSRARLKEDLRTGRIGMLMDVAYSPQLELDGTGPVNDISYAMFVRKDDGSIHLESDLAGKRIIIQRDPMILDYVVNHLPSCKLTIMDSPYDSIRALASGKYDCSLQVKMQGYYLIKQYHLSNIVVVGPPVMQIKVVYAINRQKKGASALLDHFDEGLRILRKTGEYQKLYDKWFGQLEPKVIPPGTILKYSAFSVSLLLLLLAGSAAWSWSLRKQVAQKTSDLQNEQAALRESEQRYRSLVDNIDLGISLIDADYRVVMTNPAHSKLFNKSAFDFLGQPCCRTLGRKDDQPCQSCPGKESMESGRMADCELEAFREDGTSFPLRVRAFPIMKPGGRAAGFIEVVEDISERKRVEERERRHVHQITTLLDSIPAYAFYKNVDSVYITVNRRVAEAVGRRQDEVVGKTDFDLYPREMAEKYRADDLRVIESGEVLEIIEEPTMDRDNLVTVATRKVPIKNEEGAVIGLIGLGFDITEIKRVEQERLKLETQIQHTQKLESLGILAGGIAHDFNNLLMGVLGNAELALDVMSPLAPGYDRLEGIKEASIRASELTKQMLAYSGKGKFVVEPANLNELIEEMAHLLRVSISKKVAIRYDFRQDLPLILADVTQLRQVIMNLITNASDAIGDQNGLITLATGVMRPEPGFLGEMYLNETLPEGQYVFVKVSDTGCGMDEPTRARIFDPFYTTKFTGRGLGLAAVLGIMRGHQGAIKVDSQPGAGTTFRVLFPCPSQALEAPVRPGREKHQEWQGQGKILLVDDEAIVRDVARAMLVRRGFEVLEAKDGREGVEAFRQQAAQIDLVLLDMTMPQMNGVEAFRELQAIKPDVRVILISGFNEQEVADQFADQRLTGFVQKPFRGNALAEKVREILSRQA